MKSAKFTIFTALIILIGCGTPSKTSSAANSSPTTTGSWSGTFTSSTNEAAGLLLDVTQVQSDGSMFGQFTIQTTIAGVCTSQANQPFIIEGNNTNSTGTGTVTGTLTNPPVSVVWAEALTEPNASPASIQFTGQTADDKTMTGTWIYSASDGSTCLGASNTSTGNSFTLTKQ